jgi:hypothetical protein
MPRGKPSQHYRWIRQKNGLWIPYRRRTYLYWFLFLQEAEKSDEYEVQWDKYRGWGGAKTVMNTEFVAWWYPRWEKLFAVKERNQKSIKFDLTTIRPKTETIRTNLFAWRARNTPADWTPRKSQGHDGYRERTETKRRGGRNLAIGRKMCQLDRRRQTPIIQILDPDYEYSLLEESEIQSRVGRYLKGAR